MKSFSKIVKSEILDNIKSFDQGNTALLGILKLSKHFDSQEISFSLENENVIDFFVNQIKRMLKLDISNCIIRESQNLLTLKITDENICKSICTFFKMSGNKSLDEESLPKARLIPSLVAGMFLVSGTIIDPEKEYHVEFVINNDKAAFNFKELLLNNYDIDAKITSRKNQNVVYIKESEQIEDLLTLMGAPMSSLEIMNVKILKDVRNKVNRALNCDNANIEKSLNAAQKQIEDIELIEKEIGIENLPEDLREIAIVRYENSEYTLKDLGQALQTPISRSGANHRLGRIRKIADEIRSKK